MILLDQPARPRVFELVVDELRGEVVLDHLVFGDAHAGLASGQLGQGDAVLVGGHRRRPKDPVDLLLAELGVSLLRDCHLLDKKIEILHGLDLTGDARAAIDDLLLGRLDCNCRVVVSFASDHGWSP